MATVRKLVTKLSFDADLSQADKFERAVISLKKNVVKLNTALKGKGQVEGRIAGLNKFGNAIKRLKRKIKLAGIGAALRKLRRSIKNSKIGEALVKLKKKIVDSKLIRTLAKLKRKINESKIGATLIKLKNKIKKSKLGEAFVKLKEKIDKIKIKEAIKKFGERARKGIRGLNKAIITPLKIVAKGIKKVFTGIVNSIKKHKFAIVAAVVGAVAATKRAITEAATVERLDVAIETGFKKAGGLKRVNEAIKKAKEDLEIGELFSEQDFKQGIVRALELGVSPDLITKFIKRAILVSQRKVGATFEETMTKLLEFTFVGEERALAEFGLFSQNEIEAIKKANREAANFTNSRKAQIALQRIDSKERENIENLQRVLETLTAKTAQLSGEAADSWLRGGNAIKEQVNVALTETLRIVRLIKKEGFLEGVKKNAEKIKEDIKSGQLKEIITPLGKIEIDPKFSEEIKKASKFLETLEKIKEAGGDVIKFIIESEKPTIGQKATGGKTITPLVPGAQSSNVINNVTNTTSSITPPTQNTRSSVVINQTNNIDGNVVDVSRTEQAKVYKQLQAAILGANQVIRGENAVRGV